MGGSRRGKRKKSMTPPHRKKVEEKVSDTPKSSKIQKTATKEPNEEMSDTSHTESTSRQASSSATSTEQAEALHSDVLPLNLSTTQKDASPAPPSSATSVMPQQAHGPEPPWVSAIMKKLDDISLNMTEVKRRVSHLESEICALRQLNTHVIEMEESIKFINSTFEQFRQDSNRHNDEARATKRQVIHHEKVISDTTKRLIELENRSMRDNLIFTGIPEVPNETNENTELIISDIVQKKIGIKSNVNFERVHRMGKKNADARRPRAIVAKFSHFKDRELVRKNSSRLKGTKIGIHEQFGQETTDKRKVLMPRFKAAREQGQYAQLVIDSLIIENERYRVDASGQVVRDVTYDRPPPPRKGPNVNNREQSNGSQQVDYRSLNQYPPLTGSTSQSEN